MTKILRVAVIGAGRMGADHIKRLSTRIHGAEVAAVVDVDLARAQPPLRGGSTAPWRWPVPKRRSTTVTSTPS